MIAFRVSPLIFAALLWTPSGQSAEIRVPPGDGTLAAAVAAAAAGDVLLLEAGAFSGDATIDRSLVLRPLTPGTAAIVSYLTIYGDGVEATLQGLSFTQSVVIDHGAAVEVRGNRFDAGSIDIGKDAGAVRVLENALAAGDIQMLGDGLGSPQMETPPRWVIIGNSIEGTIRGGGPDDAVVYIAGNRIEGRIQTTSSAWIVGNAVHSLDAHALFARGAWVRIIANRVYAASSSGGAWHSPHLVGGIIADSAYSLIAANLVELEVLCTDCRNAYQPGIDASGPGYSLIFNNIVRARGHGSGRIGAAIQSHSGSNRISGNIVLDYVSDSPLHPIQHSRAADVSNNLCHGGSGECPEGDGNLNTDPRLVDQLHYRLAPNSPAIDTGAADFRLADLDRTRNDMGVHGGPWAIGQYDVQREPGHEAPFVYPLSTAGWMPGGAGVSDSLEVRALGVARVR